MKSLQKKEHQVIKDNVVEVLYRSLRDSISNRIVCVDFDEKRSIIYLTLKGEVVPYPYNSSSDEDKPCFDGSIWKIDKNGIENMSESSDNIGGFKEESWAKRLLKYCKLI